MSDDRPIDPPTPAHSPTHTGAKRNKAKTRAERINPLLRAARDIDAVERPEVRADLWLKLAKFYYAEPKGSDKSAGYGDSSKRHAESAYKLLKQLESRDRAKGTGNSEKA